MWHVRQQWRTPYAQYLIWYQELPFQAMQALKLSSVHIEIPK